MAQTIFESGNSLAVRIPKSVADTLRMEKGTQVELSFDQNSLVVTPKRIPRYHLSDLLVNFPNEDSHQELDWGNEVGNEIVE